MLPSKPENGKHWVIYAPSETDDGGGYWSNEFGWCDAEQATRFTAKEKEYLSLPMSANNDAFFTEVTP